VDAVIADLERFVRDESPFWKELEKILDRMENDMAYHMDMDRVKRFHYLYQRTSNDLARIGAFAAGPELRVYLESLVARGFSETHETRSRPGLSSLPGWFFQTFPATFRRHFRAFLLAVAVTLLGVGFGAAAVSMDRSDKAILLPFEHLLGSPEERVAKEEQGINENISRSGLTFSSYLMTNNTRVAISCMALGFTFGIGTLILLFYNGAILGAVVLDYVSAGKTVFLCGWLLPHGVIEIPAILIAGQAGFVLANALIGRSSGLSLGVRLRLVWSDLVTLVGGLAIMLIWAGLVEALFSQYHEPMIPYSLKIGFGLVELAALSLFLMKSGSRARPSPSSGPNE
jgi:uncharacterized membrane protein SpoIIM required for sporulation